MLERQPEPYPLPRAVHLDDEVFRVLQAAGVADEVLARSRPIAGLRLLDGRHRVLAEFRRDPTAGAERLAAGLLRPPARPGGRAGRGRGAAPGDHVRRGARSPA